MEDKGGENPLCFAGCHEAERIKITKQILIMPIPVITIIVVPEKNLKQIKGLCDIKWHNY